MHGGSGDPPAHARHLRLADGAAGYVAVESSEQVRVWWREPGAADWSDPVVIEGGSGRYLYDTKVRVAGETVAMRALYSSVPPWDDEGTWPGTRSSIFVACRDGSCVASDPVERVTEPGCGRGSCRLARPEGTAGLQVPELSRTGDHAFFGVTDQGYLTWSQHSGMRFLRPIGLPDGGTVGAPLLAADGSMRVVVGRHRPASRGAGSTAACRLTLFTSPAVSSAADTLDLTERASTAAPTSTGDCATLLEAFSADHVLVHTDRAVPVYLARRGDGWRRTSRDPTGMLRYPLLPGRQAAGSLARTGFWHWREVLTGSPDGRTLVAQVHFPGTSRWTPPVTVARLPRRLDCFEIAPTSEPASEPFYVSVRCRSQPVNGVRSYVGVHAVTADGHSWQSVVGDDLPTRVGDDLYFGGRPAHRWSPEGGLTRVGPPVPDNSRTFELTDGTIVLITAEPTGSRCRLVARIAEPDSRRWSDPLPNAQPHLPRREPCEPVGQADGDSVGLYLRSLPGNWLPGRVTQLDGRWQVTAPRRAG